MKTNESFNFECPYCYKVIYVEPMKLPWDDGEEEKIYCDKCGKSFVIKAYATVEHVVSKEGEE